MSTVTLPLPQHLAALALATEVKRERRSIRRGVAVGALKAADVILDPPECALRMTIEDLLTAQTRWGPTRCALFLRDTGMSEAKTLGSMTERQRRVLAAML